MASDHAAVATAYAQRVVEGELPACQWVRLACQRHLGDLARQGTEGFPYRFDPDRAARVCRFIELLPHIKGEWAKARQLIRLEPWQVFVLASVFGWVDAAGRRRFRTVYEEVPRKNAKSTKLAGVALYMLAADGEPGAECYSAATTRDQAKVVWEVAKVMAQKTPGLRAHFGVGTSAHAIHVLETASVFKALSADDNTLDGLNNHCAVVDEIHAHKNRKVWDVLETGAGARTQPLMWAITTAGFDLAGIAYELRDYLCKVLQGVFADESLFGIIYTLDDEDLADETRQDAVYTDPALWAKANPNLGVSVKADDMERLARKALHTPSARPNFLTKRLNVWVKSDHAWMDMLAWRRQGDPALRLADFAGEVCWMGLDLASKVDVNSRARVFRRVLDDGRPHYYLLVAHYLPEAAIQKSRNAQYAGWAEAGRLQVTPGEVIDMDLIEADVLADSAAHQVEAVGFDPHQATQMSGHLLEQGVPMVEVRPTVLNFSEPMKEFEALVLDGRLHHDGDPVLTWMVSNVVCHRDVKDNIYPRKEREANKIDGVVAGLMALKFALLVQGPVRSRYEQEGAAVHTFGSVQ